MRWANGHVVVKHPRAAWAGLREPQILVNARLDQLKGTHSGLSVIERRKRQYLYGQAKTNFDLDAAIDLIEPLISEDVLDRMADLVIEADRTPLLAFPHPGFDDDDAIDGETPVQPLPGNAIPFAFSAILAEKFGIDEDRELIQSARVGRTKLNRWLRFLCQPSFNGSVDRDRPYILLDDVVTTGGTLAALRSHIVRSGGRVIAVSALAHSSGQPFEFPVARATLDVLLSLYSEGMRALWARKIGHDLEHLTEAEARTLVDWGEEQRRSGVESGTPLLHALRDRLDAAAATGR